MDPASPFAPLRERQAAIILDGGLATLLESREYDLRDPLWSARLLLDDPGAIRAAHLDYLRAGADVITTATYQATVSGLMDRGLRKADAAAVLESAVDLALDARDEFWGEYQRVRDRAKPLVAVSIGPYGAFLADGSEYRGNYGRDRHFLLSFHEPRWDALTHLGADLVAAETIPSFEEARVLAELFRKNPSQFGWISFSCRDSAHLADGTPIVEALTSIAYPSNVIAIGANCVAPSLASELVTRFRDAGDRPVVVYPNSGEHYDPGTKRWGGESAGEGIVERCQEWARNGALVIGGCCRTGPRTIRNVRARLLGRASGSTVERQ